MSLHELFPSMIGSKLELVYVQLIFQVRVIFCHIFERAYLVLVLETLNQQPIFSTTWAGFLNTVLPNFISLNLTFQLCR